MNMMALATSMRPSSTCDMVPALGLLGHIPYLLLVCIQAYTRITMLHLQIHLNRGSDFSIQLCQSLICLSGCLPGLFLYVARHRGLSTLELPNFYMACRTLGETLHINMCLNLVLL